MNRASFALAMCAAVGPVSGQGDEAPRLDAPAVATVFRVSPTQLSASNLSSSPRLLLFSDVHGVLASAMVPAGGTLETELPPGAARGVTLESFALAGGTVVAGARFGLELEAGTTLVVEERTDEVRAWLETPQGLQSLQTLGTQPTPFGPAQVLPSAAAAPPPLHVPVNTPDGAPPKDEPPVLDDAPLPPV